MIIAIDGPAAAGKGTLARSIAAELGFDYLDTGLLYRAVARRVLESGAGADDAVAATSQALALSADDLARPDLRGEVVGQAASKVSAVPGVRAALLDFQRAFADMPPGGVGAVLDGRDIGTVVCPGAAVKLWVVADPAVRAKRRWAEAAARGEAVSLEAVAASIAERDAREASRATAPMRPAGDAVVVDTSWLTPGEVLEVALVAALPRLRAAAPSRPAAGPGPR
jgi:cytidylate kinase